MYGFTSDFRNIYLDFINNNSSTVCTVGHDQIFPSQVKKNYSKINFRFDFPEFLLGRFRHYRQHPPLDYKNFICSFNGAPHVGRKFLVSCLHRLGWFDSEFSSKNFVFLSDTLDGHLQDYVKNVDFYKKFFIGPDSDNFFQTEYSFDYVRFDHDINISNLENQITQSFLHLVSETIATSYCPFVTEKFLYSIVTRGLFLAYAQPGWHDHVEKYYGFKKYTKLFDYGFDSIQNPVVRLVELMCMISKFSTLSSDDWKDLYLLEQDTIEYNYDHYFSQNYLKHLQSFNKHTII